MLLCSFPALSSDPQSALPTPSLENVILKMQQCYRFLFFIPSKISLAQNDQPVHDEAEINQYEAYSIASSDEPCWEYVWVNQYNLFNASPNVAV
ncbi:hypothetical protein AVEN_236365-1 [Araneus ventricosus]|uniref:Uncharacterized protein n=1 Tax=Araneus ventricosus TaxID=182803 RepID=A0A4Y2I3B7_ARAVE|nr:hypothetical protein AVEN_236365-1 [Araneus ventricosus]